MENESDHVILSPTVTHVIEQFTAAMRADAEIPNDAIDRMEELHFFHRDPYPILDYRALWSVSVEVPNQYRFEFWWQYVTFCRALARKAKLDMRTLDQALWQYSKENQGDA